MKKLRNYFFLFYLASKTMLNEIIRRLYHAQPYLNSDLKTFKNNWKSAFTRGTNDNGEYSFIKWLRHYKVELTPEMESFLLPFVFAANENNEK